MLKDFRKYAVGHLGMNGQVLDDVVRTQANYLNPYILEERQLNVTQMDVFSRLMMDRIIFLGTEVNDYTANTLQAQLLYLDSADPGKDISIYINSLVAASMQVWASMTRCSLSTAMSRQFAPAWRPRWRRCCWWLARRESAARYRIAG